MGIPSTRSSADVCINQIEGSEVLDDFKPLVYFPHSLFLIPTSELVDSCLLCYVGEGNDPL